MVGAKAHRPLKFPRFQTDGLCTEGTSTNDPAKNIIHVKRTYFASFARSALYIDEAKWTLGDSSRIKKQLPKIPVAIHGQSLCTQRHSTRGLVKVPLLFGPIAKGQKANGRNQNYHLSPDWPGELLHAVSQSVRHWAQLCEHTTFRSKLPQGTGHASTSFSHFKSRPPTRRGSGVKPNHGPFNLGLGKQKRLIAESLCRSRETPVMYDVVFGERHVQQSGQYFENLCNSPPISTYTVSMRSFYWKA